MSVAFLDSAARTAASHIGVSVWISSARVRSTPSSYRTIIGQMRWRPALAGALCAVVLCAQTSQDPEVARAQAELAHTRYLVEAGVTAPAHLEKPRQAVSDAEEHASLRRTLY